MSGANEQWSLKIDPWITHAVDAGDYQQEDGETRIPALIEILHSNVKCNTWTFS